ncbi:copper amine oxidase N-terminal domain-containing protein [Ureibacillus aquaedulcis]|uniref:Copper amine oxidase N-terminal domain-containing protein n=1 Tax=Ureibacillus aquaedulcis TaxID=3058421 RepID=A0ABT8GUN7_9BACL|nr:copper amine oxidase N-terminal domain-containing protein [Ureibacillus sp. BA0131]MDN4495125.1 copper amine oxidase N-terminal domain-containing protein [Ureibacillus sp. BA0131]
MIKKFNFALIAMMAITLFTASYHTVSANDTIKVFSNTEELVLDQKPVIKNSRTLVPIRFIAERFGAEVKWDQKKKVVTIKDKSYFQPPSYILPIGQKTVTVINGTEVIKLQLDAPSQVINGRTVVPLRFVGESLGINVRWDSKNKDVYLSDTGVNLIPSDFEKNVYNKELRKVKDFGKPTVNYEKFLAMNVGKMNSTDLEYLFAQTPGYELRLDYFYFMDFLGSPTGITVSGYPDRLDDISYSGNDIPDLRYPAVTAENFATINENTTYEEAVKIFGGPGALVKKGTVREEYKWGSSLNKDAAYISFVKKDSPYDGPTTKRWEAE